jgi:hypothetical protein
MAETRTINLEIKDNFKKVEKDIDDLNESLKDTAENNRDVSKTFEEVYGELKPLTARMGEAEDRLYELAAAGQTTTQEYRDLLQTVGEYRQVQIKTDLAVDGAAQTMTQKLGSALNGATSAFSTTQGAMALFGSENEALEESLLKVQAALAIQQGVDGLTTSYKELGGKTGIATKAQAVFNFVMNLNPILLIVSGITLAIAALLKFTSVLDPVIDGLKNFGDAIGLTDFAAEEKEKTVDRNKDFSDKQRELARQIEKERIDAMEDGMEKRLALLKFNEEGELSQIKGKGKKEGELRTAIETRYEKERDKIKEEFRVRRDRDEDVSLEDTYKAANTALASSPPPFNYIAMAASITAGIVNVKKIASQKFEGGSGDVGGNNTPSAPETTQAAPQFNTIGSSGVNQLAQLQQQPVQAYVVSGDVTSAQSLDRNRIQNATL